MTTRDRWQRPDDVGYRPPALLRLEGALRALYLAAHPPTSAPLQSGRGSGGGWSNEATPDAVRERLRANLKHVTREVDRLATRALRYAFPDEFAGEYQPPRISCSRCRKGQRRGAAFCDRCGLPLEQLQSPQSGDPGHAGTQGE